MRKQPTKAMLEKLYLKKGLGIKVIAKMLGYSHEGIKYRMRNFGIKIRKPTHTNHLRGEDSPFWKGGITYSRGYKFIKMPTHPQASPNGYVSEHRLVMEKKLGRRLERNEHIHHIDGNILNNLPENLVACFAKEHRQFEIQLVKIALRFYKEGKIVFREGEYQCVS